MTSSSPTACRPRCSSCCRPSPRSSGRCSCCARCSTCRTTRSPRAVDRTPAAVRQIAHRAREHVAARRPRAARRPHRARRGARAVPGGRRHRRPPGADRRALARRPARHRRRRRVRKAALRPILGRDKVLRFLEAVTPQDVDVELRVELVGGQPGLVAVIDGVVDSVITIDVVDGVVALALLRAQPRQADPARRRGAPGPLTDDTGIRPP